MHHGYLLFETNSIVFCATHLNPRNSSARVAEVHFLTQHVQELAKGIKPAFIMGDFNTLSPTDTILADDVDILYHGMLTRRKFFTGGVKSKTIAFEPYDQFEMAGFHDLGTANDHTVPTPINTDLMHATKLRLDYIFGNDRARSMLLSKAASIKDEITPNVSDHYPVHLKFEAVDLPGASRIDNKIEL